MRACVRDVFLLENPLRSDCFSSFWQIFKNPCTIKLVSLKLLVNCSVSLVCILCNHSFFVWWSRIRLDSLDTDLVVLWIFYFSKPLSCFDVLVRLVQSYHLLWNLSSFLSSFLFWVMGAVSMMIRPLNLFADNHLFHYWRHSLIL